MPAVEFAERHVVTERDQTIGNRLRVMERQNIVLIAVRDEKLRPADAPATVNTATREHHHVAE